MTQASFKEYTAVYITIIVILVTVLPLLSFLSLVMLLSLSLLLLLVFFLLLLLRGKLWSRDEEAAFVALSLFFSCWRMIESDFREHGLRRQVIPFLGETIITGKHNLRV